MNTKEELEDYLEQMGETWNVKSYFPEGTREEDYRSFVKSDEDLNCWLSYPENMKLVVFNKIFLEEKLSNLEFDGAIAHYERDGAAYKVRTPRYEIYLRFLHFGHVAQYTINRKTNKKGNYSKSMFYPAIYNNLVKFL